MHSLRRLLPIIATCVTAALLSTPIDAQETDVAASSLPWVADVAKAKRENTANKDLFLNFTGSDWCGYCKRLESEVFSDAAFQASVARNFVFLFVDFPTRDEAKSKVVDPALCENLRLQYGVEGFPGIVLCDAKGNPYGRTGYQPIGAEKYAEHLQELRTEGEKVKALIANSDPAKQEELLLTAFPVLESQELLGFEGYSKYLTAAAQIESLAPRVKRFLAMKRLQELLNVRTPEWELVHEILTKNENLEGMVYLNACWGCATLYLGEAGRLDDAAALLRRMLADPMTAANADGKKLIEAKLAEFEK